MNGLVDFIARGGPAMAVIAALSVATTALIMWKLWRFWHLGAWGGAVAARAVDLVCAGERAEASRVLATGTGLRARLVAAALAARTDLPDAAAREETERVARRLLAEARRGLRALELIATVAPLLGLLGTVLGMIAAFRTLQEAGAQADPAALAGGIWEALLTTAAGMAVAIPAGAAQVWFESVADRVQEDMEDAATRLFTRGGGA